LVRSQTFHISQICLGFPKRRLTRPWVVWLKRTREEAYKGTRVKLLTRLMCLKGSFSTKMNKDLLENVGCISKGFVLLADCSSFVVFGTDAA
jgi:hypothetical protein